VKQGSFIAIFVIRNKKNLRMKKKISRKKFLSTTLAGLAGIKLLSGAMGESHAENFKKRNIGKTGIMVSPVCFGATRTSEESLVRYVIEKGINYLDTGRSYANGKNEMLVGRALSGMRNKVVIQSKLALEKHELPSWGNDRKVAGEISSVLHGKLEASLKALNTDYIDILLYHSASDEALLFHPEVMKFFEGMKSSGVIKAHGFSAHNDCMNLHERNNRELFYDVLMVPFNHKGSLIHSITGEFAEWDHNRLISVLTEAGKKGIGVIAMKTCSGDKYSPSADVEASYSEAVRWVISHPFISSAAVAMANYDQVNEHIAMLEKFKSD
jgi:aryl-alcohol dehydrogenase-like predicted oxidoreductase